LLGELQGQQRFFAYASLSTGQAGLKLLAAIFLGARLGAIGVIAGISLATVLIYFLALRLLRRKLSIRPNLKWLSPAASYLAIVIPSTLAVGILLSSDVLMVKHYFPSGAAGQYAAVAAIGRAVFWGASGVAAVLFPKVAFRAAMGNSAGQLVATSLVLVATCGAAGFLILSYASHWLLGSFAGNAYLPASGYLPLYVLGMTFLGGAAVLIATHQSRGKPAFLAVLLPLTALEPALIVVFHQSLTQVVQVVAVSTSLVLTCLLVLYVLQERRGLVATTGFDAPAASVPVPQLQGNR